MFTTARGQQPPLTPSPPRPHSSPSSRNYAPVNRKSRGGAADDDIMMAKEAKTEDSFSSAKLLASSKNEGSENRTTTSGNTKNFLLTSLVQQEERIWREALEASQTTDLHLILSLHEVISSTRGNHDASGTTSGEEEKPSATDLQRFVGRPAEMPELIPTSAHAKDTDESKKCPTVSSVAATNHHVISNSGKIWVENGKIPIPSHDEKEGKGSDHTSVSKEELLHRVPVFANAPEDFRRIILPCLVREYFSPGQDIVVEGDYGTSMFFIVKGFVEGNRRGKTFSFKDGDFFGEIAILRGGVRSATCTAKDDCFLFSLSREDFLAAMTQFPQVRDDVKKICIRRFEIEKYPWAERSQPEVIAAVEALVEEQFNEWKKQSQQKMVSFHKGEKIGSGAAGTVYSCINNRTGQPLAVKIVRLPTTLSSTSGGSGTAGSSSAASVPSSSAAELSVEQESALMQDLKHPNLVQGYGMQKDPRDPGKLFVFMELAPLGSLNKVIRSMGRLTELAARSYIRQALLGLKYLHENEVLHRDIKPSNMLLGSDGSVKLADFGISAVLATSQSANKKTTGTRLLETNDLNICGTPAYMSPDAINGRYSVASDIWAMGCSLLEMITGKPPWSYHPFENSTQLLFHIATCGSAPTIPRVKGMTMTTMSNTTTGGGGESNNNTQVFQEKGLESCEAGNEKTQGIAVNEKKKAAHHLHASEESSGEGGAATTVTTTPPTSTFSTKYISTEVEQAFARFAFKPEECPSHLPLPDCSPELVTLLAQMLSSEPQSRGDVGSVLAHDWFVLDEAQLLSYNQRDEHEEPKDRKEEGVNNEEEEEDSPTTVLAKRRNSSANNAQRSENNEAEDDDDGSTSLALAGPMAVSSHHDNFDSTAATINLDGL